MKTGYLVATAVLAGCASTSDIVPAGKDTYMMTAHARGPYPGGKSTMDALTAANGYCAKLGKVVIVRHTEKTGLPSALGENSTVVFSCVPENDAEYQRQR